jgi:tetrahydromethanopterin:alpha-L-glutamate ligase
MSITFLIPHQSYESQRVQQELLNLGLKMMEIETWDSIRHPITNFPNVLWVRFSPKIPIIYQLTSVEEFEAQGTRVVNSKAAIETCDKMSTYLFWKNHLQHEVRMPQTLITRDIDVAKNFTQEHKCIFKPIDRGLGQGVQLLSNNAGLPKTLQTLLDTYGLLFLQEFIESQGYDIRAIVIAGENIIEYARLNADDFRYNIHLGGEIRDIKKVEIEPALIARIREIALTIAEKTKLDMVGIDFMISNQAIYLLEWNAFFNFQGAEKTLKVNVAKRIAEFLYKLIKS